MIPYLLLLFLPLLFSFLVIDKTNGRYIATIGGTAKILNRSCALPMFFFVLLVMLMLRHETVGTDIERYKYYFNRISRLDFENIGRVGLEPLYLLLNWLISRVTKNYQVFLAIIAIITTVPIAKLYCEDREHGFLKIVLFLNMSNFVLLFSGLRQCIALALGLIAYRYVREKKLLHFLAVVCIALGFHHSAFMIFFLYPLYYTTFKRKHLWFVIPAIVLVFVFNRPIFSIAVNLLSLISSDKYTAVISSTGAYAMLLLFAAFAVFSYVLLDEKRADQETLGLRNFLLAAVVLQSFAPIHTLAMRLNYYYIIFIPILIPKILKSTKHVSSDIVRLIKVCFVVFFAGYFLYTTYIGCKTGVSALDTYPYVPFWQ